MGLLELVGSLKLQVSFAKEPYRKDDILQKRLIVSRSLLIVATPYAGVACVRLIVSSSSSLERVPWIVQECIILEQSSKL